MIKTLSRQASRTPLLESAPGPPWSAVEYASTHLVPSRLRLAPGGGNEFVSQCKMRGQTSSGQLGLCPGSDGRSAHPLDFRLRMVRHGCVRNSNDARACTCSTTCRKRTKRGSPGRRPPSCSSLRLRLGPTSALPTGQVELRYPCSRKRLKGHRWIDNPDQRPV